jgi:transposase
MSDTVRMHVSKGALSPARRIEVFTGSGRRRIWAAEEKAAIVAESYSSGDTVCGVARRHGLTHSQLFAWRRAAGGAQAKDGGSASTRFVPAVVGEPPPLADSSKREQRGPSSTKRSGRALGVVEVEIDGVTIRVGRGAESKTVTAVIRALKAGS